MVQRRRRLRDMQESAGSIPAGITLTTGLSVFRQHAAVVRRKTGFNSRTDLSISWACMPMEATDPCKIGVIGSTPIRSTGMRSDGPKGRHRPGVAEIRVRFPVGPLTKRKVAGYGLPGRTANACHLRGDEGSNPLPSAYGSMVKRTSCLASNEKFRVQVLVGLLRREKQTEGQDWRRDPVGSRLSFTALRVRLPPFPLETIWCPWCTR